MADRLLAAACALVAAAMIWAALQLEIAVQYEPVGPKAFPVILGVLMIASVIVLLVRPDPTPELEGEHTKRRLLLGTVLLAAYVLLFEHTGFVIATAVIAFAFALVLEARALPAAVFAVLLAVISYALFTGPLELNLPSDPVFGL